MPDEPGTLPDRGKTGSERRKQKRFVVEDAVFAVLRPEFKVIGKIQDISRGGVSFQYMAHETSAQTASLTQLDSSPELDIFMRERELYLSQVPCAIVYDIPVADYNGYSQDSLTMKRCGVQFRDLSPKQSERVDSFISALRKIPQ